ncbi:MAG: hypothetical protein GX575_32830, partial [Candidatus Anammoximicrobium sp.]|nr:hypothetical protein [Candidatus Anammoximicrobium sp.]
ALNITIDTTPPAVTVNSLMTNEATPAITGTVSDGTLQVVVNGKTYMAGDGNLTVNGTDWTLQIPAGDALGEGTYPVTASSTDMAGNSGTDGTTNELIVDTTPPSLAITDDEPGVANIAGGNVTFTFTFSEAVTGFEADDVTVAGGAKDAFTAVSGTVYTLVVTPTANSTANITVDVAAGVATDAAGNPNTAAAQAVQAVDTLNPTVTHVTADKTNGTYGEGALIPITIAFNEPVYVTGTPQLTLETGTIDCVVDYTSGSGTDTLTFEYTVQAGDTSPDLDYENASALALNGGTIRDLAANQATLTLPAPGAAGSLGANKNLVIDTTVPSTTSFTRKTPAGSPTNENSLVFLATFNEAVVDVDVGDFQVAGTTTATVTGVQQVTSSTYDVTVSGGDLASFDGVVGIDLASSQNITDSAGNPLSTVEPTTDETYLLDNAPPWVDEVAASNVWAEQAGQTTYQFTIAFADNVAIDAATLGLGDATVTGPNSFTQNATFVSVTPSGNGTPRTATYQITPPGGNWDDADNGTYTSTLNADQVFDTAGNAAEPVAWLATFTVNMSNEIPVTTFSDIIDPLDGEMSLREAIIAANTCSGDVTIVLGEGTYSLTIAGAGEDQAVTGDLDILAGGSVTILGAGAGQTIIDGAGLLDAGLGYGDRIFDVRSNAAVTIQGVTLTGGSIAPSDSSSSPERRGGGVRNMGGTVSIHTSLLSGNWADMGGSGIHNETGTTSVIDSTISGNLATTYGGGINNYSGTVYVINSLLSENAAVGGGAVCNYSGTVNITHSTLSENSASGDGGGILNSRGTVNISDSTLSGNTASARGGAVYGSSGIDLVGTVNVLNSTISGNWADQSGGGIYNWSGEVQVVNSTVSGNSAGFHGGGLYTMAVAGVVTIRHSTFSQNRADSAGSGNYSGGGISSYASTTTLQHTIVAGNFRGTGTDPDDITNEAPLDAASAYNLIGDPNSADNLEHGVHGNIVGDGAGNLLDIQAILNSTLADNGGPTLTFALIAGSPAVDAGDPAFDPDDFDPPLSGDQRGLARVVDGISDGTARIDIGAFELEAPSRTLGVTLVDGTLAITDTDGAANQLTIVRDGADLVATDANERFAAAPEGGTLSNGSQTLTIPLALITGSLVFDLGGGNDVLTVGFAGGNPIPTAGLSYDGGADSDALVLDGGAFHTSTFTYVSASAGSIALDPDGPGVTAASVISYTGLEPVTSSIASDIVELTYTGGDETITVTDAGGSQTTVVSTLGETTTFDNPTVRLEIAATSGTDVVNVNSLAAGYASLVIGGDDVTDVVNFNGPLTLAADQGLTVADAGTVNLPNTASDIAASGTGALSITALKTIVLASGASLTALDGNIDLSANQQATPTTGGPFTGISLSGATVSATGAGNLSLAGRGGTSGSDNYGVQLAAGAVVAGGLTGSVTVEGTGGASTGNSNRGVVVTDSGSTITSNGGAVLVEGTGGGAAESATNYGIFVYYGASITSAGTTTAGTVTVRGFGGNTSGTGDGNYGVRVQGTNAQIKSSGGAVLVEGTGGGAGSSVYNAGVGLRDAGTITSEGTGSDATVTVKGFGGNTTGTGDSNWGTFVTGSNSQITSSGGDVLVEGTGGGATSSVTNYGVYLFDGGTVTSADTAADVTVQGIGGNPLGSGTSHNYGVYVSASSSQVTSSGGNIEVIGAGGGGDSSYGIYVASGKVTGTTGSPTVSLTADSMYFPTATINAGANTVHFRPLTAGTQINLGGADVLAGSPLILGLTDAELDRITAGTLTIGDAASGAMTVSAAISRPASTAVNLVSGDGITFNPGSLDTAGGALVLDPGTSVQPLTAGTEITVGSVSFAAEADLAIDIDGTTVDAQYSQLNVAGTVNLTGSTLALTGSHTPAIGDTFTIVNNDGSDAVIGTFAGLPEGAEIPNLLGSGRPATITYVGGDGNDVMLTVNDNDYIVSLSLTPSSVLEDGAANLLYTFTSNAATTVDVTVSFAVSGTAVFADDYTQSGAASFSASAGTVTIPAGADHAEVTIDPSADTTLELAETVVLTLTSGAGYALGSPASARGTIWDDEPAPAADGWAAQEGLAPDDRGNDVAVDSMGNVYVAGKAGKVDPPEAADFSVAKYAADGTPLWRHVFGPGGNDDDATGIAVDAYGQVYVTGHFQGTVDFDPGAGEANRTTAGNAAYYDIFVLQLDTDGNFGWVKTYGQGDLGYDKGHKIAIAEEGRVYVVGLFSGAVDFDPGVTTPGDTVTTNGGYDAFVLALDAAGSFRWVRAAGGATSDNGSGVAVDGTGNVYVAGNFEGTVVFDASHTLVANGSMDAFVWTLDSSGNSIWAGDVGDSTADANNYSATGTDVAVTAEGSVYLLGSFRGEADFDPSAAGTASRTTPNSSWNAYVLHLSDPGDGTLTFQQVANLGSWAQESGNTVAIDAAGNVLVGGSFQDTVDFNPDPDDNAVNDLVGISWGTHQDLEIRDGFLLSLSSSLDFRWVRGVISSHDDRVWGVAVSPTGTVVATGYFSDTVTFDHGDGTTTLASAGGTDAFVLSLVPDINTLPTISDIADQAIPQDGNTGALSFSVNDLETPAADLTLAGSSSNTALVPNANVVFGGSGANRTVAVTPLAGQSGTATITVTVTDASSGSAADTFLLTVTEPDPPPVVTITDDEPWVANIAGGDVIFTFTFSEPVTGFEADDITVAGGAKGAFTPLSGTVYTLAVTPNANSTTNITVDVAASVAVDTAGNPNTAATQAVQAVDTLAPTVSVDIVDAALNDSDDVTDVTFTFSEAVTGFTADDVTAVGGTLSGFSGSGTSYSATFTANDGIQMTGSVTVAADSYTDVPSNLGAAGSDTVAIDTLNGLGVELEFSFDVPGVGIVTPDALLELPQNTTVTVTLTAVISPAAIGGYQLNFGSSDVATGQLQLHTWSGNTAFLGVDTTLNTPTDTFVSAGALTAQNAPVVLGTFELVTPDVGPGTEFLLTTQYVVGNELVDTILSTSAGDTLPIADFGDVVIRIGESVPPQVSSLTWNTQQVNPADLPKGAQPTSWAQQRSRIRDLTVVFDEPVRPVTAADLVLTNLGVNAPADADTVIALQDSQLAMADGNTRLIVSLTAGQLTDGVYELRILPTVKDVAGNALDGDGNGTGGDAYVLYGNATNKFLRFSADWNGSGGVNIQDFATFSYWFSTAAPPAPSYVDLNNSGGINIQDFSGFAANFAKGVTYPPAGDLATGDEVPAGKSGLLGDGSGENEGVELVYTFNVPGVGIITPDTELTLPENTTVEVTITAQVSPQAVSGFQLNFSSADVTAGELQLHTWSGNAAFLPVDAVLNTPADPFVSGGALTAQNVPLVLGTFKLVTPDVAAATDYLLTVNCLTGNELSDTMITDVNGVAQSITDFGDIILHVTADDTEPPVVTVSGQTTTDTTPTITGTVSDGTLQVVVNGVTYNPDDGHLSVTGTNWSLTIPAGSELAVGKYDVAASSTDTAGNIGGD